MDEGRTRLSNRTGEINAVGLQQPLLSDSVAINVEPRWGKGRRPPELLVSGNESAVTPPGSPESLGRLQQGSWLLAAVAFSLLYAGLMFAAIVFSAYDDNATLMPWLFIGAATSAITSSMLVFSAALKLHQQRLAHHQANAHRYRRRKGCHHYRSRSPSDSAQQTPRNGPVSPALPRGLAPPDLNSNPPPGTASSLFRALPHLQQQASTTPTPGGIETPGNPTPSHEWNLAIGVDPKQENPVSLPIVLCAAVCLAASAFTNLGAFALAETAGEGTNKLAVLLAHVGLLLFLFSLGSIVSAVVRKGCSPDGTYAALWLVVDAPLQFSASRRGTSSWPSPRTPKTPKPVVSPVEGVVALMPSTQARAPQQTPIHPPTPPSRQILERAVARILRGTVKTSIMISLGGLYLNLPLALVPIVASLVLTGPRRLVDSDQSALVYGLLFPLLFLTSALDFATFFFFVPRAVSALWLALKHPRIASSHVRSGKGAMLLSSVVLLLPFVEFFFCVACTAVYLSAEGGSIGFGHLVITPWQCVGIASAGLLVVLLTSLVCIVSLKVRISQLMEPHKLSSRTTKGVVYASLLVFVVVGVATVLFPSALAWSLCPLALLAFVPFVKSSRQTEQTLV